MIAIAKSISRHHKLPLWVVIRGLDFCDEVQITYKIQNRQFWEQFQN